MKEPILRDYQQQAVASVMEQFDVVRSTLLVMPTGTGKTVTFAKIATNFYPSQRVLVIAHRMELLRQARRSLLRVGVSESDVAMIGGEYGNRKRVQDDAAKVTLASKDSLHTDALQRWNRSDFGLVIVDESHHSTATTYAKILEYFDTAKVLGVTATPDRLDGAGLERIFESVAFSYEIREAIECGYLVPIRQKFVMIEGLKFADVKTSYGDFSERDLSRAMMENNLVDKMLLPTIEKAGDRRTIIFAASLKHAEEIATRGNLYAPEKFAWVSGEDDAEKRAEILSKFASGEVQFLANRDLLTEGVDIPIISCVAMFRPTKSRSLYTQMVGRGMRLLGDTYKESIERGKRDLLVLDFVGNSEEHSLVCTADYLTGREKKAFAGEEKGKEKPARDEQQMGLELVENFASRHRLDSVQYSTKNIDPFLVFGVKLPKASGFYAGIPPTEKQISMLLNCGLSKGDIQDLDKGQASKFINEIVYRRKAGLASYKQAKILIQHGCNPNLSGKDATQIITMIAENGWRSSADIRDVSEQWAITQEAIYIRATARANQ